MSNGNEVVINSTPKRVPIMPNMSRSTKRRIEEDERELQALLSQRTTEEPSETSVQTTEVENAGQTTPDPSGKPKSEDQYEKRYKDSQRYITQLTQKVKELEQQLSSSTSEAPTTKEAVEAWMKKYPQSADVIKAMIKEQTQGLAAKYEEEKEALEAMRYEATREKTELEVLKKHPDFMTLKDSDEFHSWLEQQDEAWQKVIYDTVDKPNSVVAIITAYKASTGKLTKNEPSSDDSDFTAAATTVRSRTASPSIDQKSQKGVYSEAQVARMSAAEFEKHFERIQEARRTGKFIYDLPKKSA